MSAPRDLGASSPRPLGALSLFALGLNGVVGVGIFFAPGKVAAAVPGAAGALVYVAVALACAPVALAYSRLGRAFGADGGPYLFAREAFGADVAFGIGVVAYVSALFSTASVVVGLVRATASSLGAESARAEGVVAVALVLGTTALLTRGLRVSAFAWSVVTVAKLVPLVALVVAGAWLAAPPASPHAGARFEPAGALHAALVVLFAVQGFEIVPLPAGQVERPSRSVPLALGGALLVATALYASLQVVAARALPDLDAHGAPLADAARALGGRGFGAFVAAGTSVSAFGIVVGMLAMTPRYLAALGGDDAFGGRVGALSAGGVYPRAAWITAALVVALVVVGFATELSLLLELSSVAVLAQYAVTAAALAALAAKGRRGLSRRDAWPAPLAGLACAMLVAGATAREVATVALLVVAGFAWRALARRKCAA